MTYIDMFRISPWVSGLSLVTQDPKNLDLPMGIIQKMGDQGPSSSCFLSKKTSRPLWS